MPSGNCVTETSTTTTTTQPVTTTMPGSAVAAPNRVSERVSGKITIVNKNMITLQHGDHTLMVNDSARSTVPTRVTLQPDATSSPRVWEDGTFYANRFD